MPGSSKELSSKEWADLHYDTKGGPDFDFRVIGVKTKFQVKNLNRDERTWEIEKEDHNYYSLIFEEPINRPICIEIYAKKKVRYQDQLLKAVVRRFFVDIEHGVYEMEDFGPHKFAVGLTHEVHFAETGEEEMTMLPEESEEQLKAKGWDTVSFGIINRQITHSSMGKTENYPQWLMACSFDGLFHEETNGMMKGLPFTPLDYRFWVEGIRDPEDVPQKTPIWHMLRSKKIGSSTAYKVGMGCFTQQKYTSKPLVSNQLMRIGSFLEDAFAMALVQHTGMFYVERGWRDHPMCPEKWGDSVDGLLVDKTMTLDRIPNRYLKQWRRHGVKLEDIDITKGVLEIKCSDTDTVAACKNYYLGQTTWHMSAFDRYWGIVLRGQPCGKNARLQCYYWYRDLDLEKAIMQNVKDGTQFKDDLKQLEEWGKRRHIAGLRNRLAAVAKKITDEREDPNNESFTIPWPNDSVRKYLELVPNLNKQLEQPTKGFPEKLVSKLKPVLNLSNQGWIENLPMVYMDEPEELVEQLNTWTGKFSRYHCYTVESLKAKLDRQKETRLIMEDNAKQMDQYRANARAMKNKSASSVWIDSKKKKRKKKKEHKSSKERKKRKNINGEECEFTLKTFLQKVEEGADEHEVMLAYGVHIRNVSNMMDYS